MPLDRLIGDGSFDPEAIRLMGLAYEDACARANSEDAVIREAIAARIIAAGRKGERDVKKLADLGLNGQVLRFGTS
jgi:hypothetical protein